jgi:hypothetical protein
MISHYCTQFLGYLFFALTTTRKTTKWIGQIIKLKIEKSDLEFDVRKINKTGLITLPPVNRSWIVDAYRALKSILREKQWLDAEKRIRLQTEVIRKNFQLLFKALVIISIYFLWTVKHFNGLLYAITVIGILGAMIFLWYSYAVLDVLPTLIRKIDAEIQKHLEDENPK